MINAPSAREVQVFLLCSCLENGSPGINLALLPPLQSDSTIEVPRSDQVGAKRACRPRYAKAIAKCIYDATSRAKDAAESKPQQFSVRGKELRLVDWLFEAFEVYGSLFIYNLAEHDTTAATLHFT